MFSILVIGLCCITAVCASISGHITSGSCVCLTTNGVNARHDPDIFFLNLFENGWPTLSKQCIFCSSLYTPNSYNSNHLAGLHGRVVGSVNNGECYTFNGGILTTDGYTWYQLQHVHGGLAWVAGNFLQISTHSHCTNSGAVSSGNTHKFASGLVSQHCMQCICNLESGCQRKPCAWDVNSNSCGYFQIKENYWIDCGKLGESWEACALDLDCASQCVQRYMARYIGHYGCSHDCESYARMHNGGPAGCKHSNTVGYWRHIESRGCKANS